MCVIILRNPGVSIPFEKVRSACIVNPDGWGLAVADRGKLEITKGLSDKTDPEVIFKHLEDAKNQSIMLHLRYVTAGARTLDNCHPWLFLEHKTHGIDAAFCHNGTLYTWKEHNSDRPDSWWINEKLVKPLYERVHAFAGENFLRDEFAQELLEQTAGSNSLFGLIDGNGLQLAVNHTKGTEFEGWWASNEYSFDAKHREPDPPTTPDKDPWEDCEKYYLSYGPSESTPRCNTNFTVPPNDNEPVDALITMDEDEMADMEELLEQGEKIKETLDAMKTKRMNPKLIKDLLKQKRPTFCEICKIDDLREMTRFDPEDLCEMAVFYPEATAVLLKDLLTELYLKNVIELKRKNHEAMKAA